MTNPGADAYATDVVNTPVSIAYMPGTTLAQRVLLQSLGWMFDPVTGRWKRVQKQQHHGTWLGFPLEPTVAAALTQQLLPDMGGAENALHVTLAYLPGLMAPATLSGLLGALTALTLETPPAQGRIGGIARFVASTTSDDQDVLVALVDSAALEQLWGRVRILLATLGMPVPETHGYTPHITLHYGAPGIPMALPTLKAVPLTFTALTVQQGDTVLATLPLQGSQEVRMGKNRVLKTDESLRYTLGIVYEPDAIDTQGDFARAPAIQKACWEFSRELQKSAHVTKSVLVVLQGIRKALDEGPEVRVDVTELFAVLQKDFKGLGDQHTDWPAGLGEIVENYIAPVTMDIDGETVTAGTWMLGCIWSPEAFAKVQSGERTGWSMGGIADRLLDQKEG